MYVGVESIRATMIDRISALGRTELFSTLPSTELEVLSSKASEHCLRKGEILFMAGDPGAGLYVVVDGAIRAYRVGSDGREQVLHVEKSGATLAEVSVFDGGPYPSTTAAEDDTTLLFIRREDVLELCLTRPSISLAALKLLAGRMRKCAATIENLSLRDVDQRVAQLLAEEGSGHLDRAGDSVQFELGLTHQQIAARIGSVREVVSRALNRLHNNGLIQMTGRRIFIVSIKALREFVAG